MTTRFAVLRELGQGGEGRVLEVFDHARGQSVALKEARGPRRLALADEFRLLYRLRHPHLVAVHDFFLRSPLDASASAYTLDHIDGQDLVSAVAHSGADALLSATDATLQALAQLHAAGVAHLDLKPDNILVASANRRVRLIDFGIAHPLGQPLSRVFGSRSYLAPELAEGVVVRPAADLFGLGVVLAECLFAQSAQRVSPAEARALANASPEHRRKVLTEAAPTASLAALSPIIELAAHCLEPDPSARPSDIAAAARLYGAARRHGLSLVGPGAALALARSGGLVGREQELAAVDRRLEAALPTFVTGEGRAAFITELVHQAQLAGRPAELWPLSDEPTIGSFLAALERLGGPSLTHTELDPARDLRLDPALNPALNPDRFAQHLLDALAPTQASDHTTGLLGLTHLERAPLPIVRFVEALHARPNALRLALVIRHDAPGANRSTEPSSSTLTLPPANEAAVAAFVHSRFGAFAHAETLVRWLHAAAAGSFLELEALCELLVARGLLAMGPGGWTVASLDGVVVRGRIPERLSAFSEAARRVIGALAVLRDRAPRELLGLALADTLALSEPEVDRALDELELAGWLDRGGLAPVVAAALSPAAPEVMAGSSGDTSDLETRLLLAFHKEESPHRLSPALHARVVAAVEGGLAGAALLVPLIAERLTAYRVEEARSLTTLGLELVGPDTAGAPTRLALLRHAARIADLLGPRETQRDALTALLEALPDASDEALEVRASLFWTKTRIGDPSFLGEGEILRARAAARGRHLLAAEVGVHLAIAATQRGELATAETLLRSASDDVAAADRDTSDPESLALMARIANNLGNIALYRHDHTTARNHYEDALDKKRRQGDPVGARIALGNLALVELELGEPSRSLRALIESREIALRTGHRRGEAWSLLTMAELAIECGALSYAKRRAEEAARIAEQLGDTLVHSDALATLAEIELSRVPLTPPQDVCEIALHARTLALAGGSRWTASRAGVIAVLCDGALDETSREHALETTLRDPDADPATRRLAAQHLIERRFARGLLTIDKNHLEPLVIADPHPCRVGLRAASAWHTGLRALELSDRAAARRHARLANERLVRWFVALPRVPLVDGVDTEGAIDGPSSASARLSPALRALVAVDGALDGAAVGWEDVGRGGAAPSPASESRPFGAPMSTGQVPIELALGDDETIARKLAEALTALVVEHGAERGFLVDFGAEPVAVIEARDPDGEALHGGLKRLPEVALEAAARATDRPWRGAEGRGSLCVVPALVPLHGAPRHLALILQNRFVAEAFTDTNAISASAGNLLLAARLRLLSDAFIRLSRERDEANQRALAVERESTEEIRTLRRELESTREQLGPTHAYKGIVYTSGAMKRMLRQVDRVVTTELPVHIHGESGTGKELIAHAIHELGPRGRGPFVPQNCTAIPPTLFESELFGHERGSFTGAVRSAEGLFRRAHLGTLFLDEIGDLPLELQAKLLRVLETGEVRPVGATRSVKVDVRIVSATHRDLKDLITKGLFREDLYYRLNVIRIEIPALRERPEDIPLLARHFLAARDPNPRHFDDAAMKALVRFPWPGNVRQLENEVSRAALLADGESITLSDLSPDIAERRPGLGLALVGEDGASLTRAAGPLTASTARAIANLDFGALTNGPLKDRVDHLETIALKLTLESTGHNKSEVARLLGLSRAGLNLKLKRLGLWDGE